MKLYQITKTERKKKGMKRRKRKREWKRKGKREREKQIPVERSKQSAALGLPILGASLPTSLQKFQASKPTLSPSLLIPGSPTAEALSLTLAEETQKSSSNFAMKKNDINKGKYFMAAAFFPFYFGKVFLALYLNVTGGLLWDK